MKVRTLPVLILSSICLLLALIYYVYHNTASVECKATAIYSVKKLTSSDLDGVRFNIMGIIANDYFGNRNIQKNSLLINADEDTLTIISQIRIAGQKASNELNNIKAIKNSLAEALKKVSSVYGFTIRNNYIHCAAPPNWYQLLTPLALLMILIICFVNFYLRKARSI